MEGERLDEALGWRGEGTGWECLERGWRAEGGAEGKDAVLHGWMERGKEEWGWRRGGRRGGGGVDKGGGGDAEPNRIVNSNT